MTKINLLKQVIFGIPFFIIKRKGFFGVVCCVLSTSYLVHSFFSEKNFRINLFINK